MDPQQRAIYYTLYRMDPQKTCYLLYFVQDGSSKSVAILAQARLTQGSNETNSIFMAGGAGPELVQVLGDLASRLGYAQNMLGRVRHVSRRRFSRRVTRPL